MSADAAGTAPEEPSGVAVTEQRLLEVLHPEFLERIGYTRHGATIVFPADHLTLGWTPCPVSSCGRPSSGLASGLCPTCVSSWKRAGRPDLETFLATAVRTGGNRIIGDERCPVVGCALPPLSRSKRLCQAHDGLRAVRGLTVEQLCRAPDVRGHARVGPCLVAACTRDRSGKGLYCGAHRQRWIIDRKRHPGLEEERWQVTTRPIAEGNVLVLAGLPDQLVLELLYGLQDRDSHGLRTDLRHTRTLIDQARAQQICTIADLSSRAGNHYVVRLRNHIVGALDRLAHDPHRAWSAPRWSLEAFGHSGTIRFDGLTQSWLQEAAKRWVAEVSPTRRGRGAASNIRTHLIALGYLSASLTRHRDDHGHDHRRLGRGDIVDFMNRMAYLESAGQVSTKMRRENLRLVRKLLVQMRTLGLTRDGQCLHGWPDDFALSASDLPDAIEADEPGRDVPEAVMAVLVTRLDGLHQRSSTHIRTAVELMMDTGRRPSEICELRADCLTRDGDQRPIMVWNNSKLLRHGRRLPIPEATATVIADQVARVAARYPDTPLGELALLPARIRNPHGRRGVTAEWVGRCHREWLTTFELTAPTVVEVDGQTVTRELPYDRTQITLYSYRHSYAQRHADAGVGVDVLAELMDHTSLNTTQGYYRVSEHRRRDAVDRVTTMQFDRHGARLWRSTEKLLDAERVRRCVGEVAVPYGRCSEPSNVAAGGGACPARYRCVGCDHFGTDVSYLPDLEAYLADLRRNRERLLATATEGWVDDWARHEALPSDEEIRRVRHLIDRVREDLDDLDQAERAEIERAVDVVRRARRGAVGLGMPRVRPELASPREEHR